MKEDFYISLLYKKLNKSIEPEEEKQLSDWISASDEHRSIAQQVELAWKESPALAANPKVNLDDAFSELEAIIQSDTARNISKEPQIKSLSPRRNWLKIAAAITFLLATGLLLKDYFNPKQVKVEWTELRTQDKIEVITLPDNSIVHVNKNTTITYPKVFTGESRQIKLEGEAFFEVTRDLSHPFIIEAAHEIVEVLGTSFRVKAYEKEAQSLVQVASGKVAFRSKNSSKEVILTKNEMGVLHKKANSLEKTTDTDPNEMTWGTQSFTFKNTPISYVLKQLEDFYQVEFELENTSVADCRLTSTHTKEELATVLETITLIIGMEFQKSTSNTYVVKGGSCK